IRRVGRLLRQRVDGVDVRLQRVDVFRHLLDEHEGRLVLALDGERRFLQIEHQLAREHLIGDFGLQLLGERLDALADLVGLLLQLDGLILGGLIIHDESSPKGLAPGSMAVRPQNCNAVPPQKACTAAAAMRTSTRTAPLAAGAILEMPYAPSSATATDATLRASPKTSCRSFLMLAPARVCRTPASARPGR